MFALMPSVPVKSFDAFPIANDNGDAFALLANAQLVTWQTSFGTAPTAINIIIETSLDNSTWNTSATTTTTTGEIGSFVTSALFIRATIVSHTDGDTVTVTIIAKTASLASFTNPIPVNNLLSLQAVSDDANDSEPALVTVPLLGNEVAQIIASSFTSGSIWTGLILQVVSNSVRIFSQVNGASSDTALVIASGTGGLTLSTSGVITLASNTVIADGIAIKTDAINAHTALLQAYDVDGAAYKTFLTLTNGNTPDMTIAPPSGGTVTVQASTFKSSDGSTGATGSANNTNTLTIKNGLVTNIA